MIIFTSDVERLSRFCRESFGLSNIAGADEGWAELSAGGCNIAFHRHSEGAEVRDGWVKIVFGSLDVRAEKRRLEALGVEMSDVVEFGNIQLCDGQDSDGNPFQISSRGL